MNDLWLEFDPWSLPRTPPGSGWSLGKVPAGAVYVGEETLPDLKIRLHFKVPGEEPEFSIRVTGEPT